MKKPRTLRELEDLARPLGFDVEVDHDGQLILYTNLMTEDPEDSDGIRDTRDIALVVFVPNDEG